MMDHHHAGGTSLGMGLAPDRIAAFGNPSSVGGHPVFDLAGRPGARRIALVVVLAVVTVGALGWLGTSATPAAQQAAERVEPYDPLK